MCGGLAVVGNSATQAYGVVNRPPRQLEGRGFTLLPTPPARRSRAPRPQAGYSDTSQQDKDKGSEGVRLEHKYGLAEQVADVEICGNGHEKNSCCLDGSLSLL
ncbi:MAG: hypothetical protein IV107_11720 [Paucibacter sp.]|nr:hypothetical protein [Roseateles sp.]